MEAMPPLVAVEDAPDNAPWIDEHLESEPLQRSRKGSKTSDPFQKLLDQLLQQHVREVNNARYMSTHSAASSLGSSSADRLGKIDKRILAKGASMSSMTKNDKLKRGASKVSQDGGGVVRRTAILNAFGNSEDRKAKRQKEQENHGWLYNTDNTTADDEDQEDEGPVTRLERWQRRLLSWKYEMLIALTLAANVLWMAFELQVSGGRTGYDVQVYAQQISEENWQSWQTAFLIGNMVFTFFFFFDVVLRVSILRWIFWKAWMNYVDLAVAMLTILEAFAFFSVSGLPVDPILLRIIRMGKLARATRLVTLNSVLSSLELLIKYLAASTHMLFWSFCLLTFIQCIAGILASTLCIEFVNNKDNDEAVRKEVWLYYGTFTRTVLTMFEILFANWGPPCRVLVENISEWFCVFFLIYRCVLGFAVLNVVNAVFVQQTIKTASSDEELAFKQKERDIAMYTRKVKNLFNTLDTSGDGCIDQEEFGKLVKHPMLKFWMSQLELEYHDLLSLFEYLDNGDGEITLREFIEGATRLRGSAKALDIWRMETKVELLFEQLVGILQDIGNTRQV